MGKRAANQAQATPARRVKRARRPDSQVWSRPPSTAATQIHSRRGDRLRPCCSSVVGHTTGTPTWGAKRARTALDGASSLLHPKWRDWANLGDGPAGLIAERVLADDVAGYIRFRAVCRPWRRCCADPRAQVGLDARFHPRRWIMIEKAETAPRRNRFLNVCTGECVHMDLTELDDHELLTITPEGLLLLLRPRTHAARILNPLTRQLTDLPPLTTALLPEERPGTRCAEDFLVHGAAVAADSTVALCMSGAKALAVAKPGDERWTLIAVDKAGRLWSPLSFAGRVYCASSRGVMTLETTSPDEPPRLVMAAEVRKPLPWLCIMTDSLHLVDNGGELMLLHRKLRPRPDDYLEYRREYEVCRVDLDAGILVPVTSLGGRAVFIGSSRMVSVSPDVFPSISGDTIYLGFDRDEKTMAEKIDGYHLADGTTEPSNLADHCERFHPCTAVDCISWCIQGTGKLLVSEL